MRQNEARRVRNRTHRSEMRSRMKNVLEAVAVGDVARAEAALRLAIKKVDQVAAKRTIHPNMAARLKSRLTRRVNRLGAAGS